MPRLVCMNCGAVGRVETVAPGSPALELIFWLLIIPGPAYSWWRWRNRRRVCALCGDANLLPDDATQVRQAFQDRSKTVRSNWELARDALFVLVVGAGVSIVVAFMISALFPSVRESRWFALLVMAPALVIAAHPLITLFHLLLYASRPKDRRPD